MSYEFLAGRQFEWFL